MSLVSDLDVLKLKIKGLSRRIFPTLPYLKIIKSIPWHNSLTMWTQSLAKAMSLEENFPAACEFSNNCHGSGPIATIDHCNFFLKLGANILKETQKGDTSKSGSKQKDTKNEDPAPNTEPASMPT